MNTLALHPASLPTPTKDKLLSINFLEHQSLLIIKGWSVTPETRTVYSVILDEIRQHLTTHGGITINFEYKIFNTFTTHFLFKLIKTLDRATAQGKRVDVNWIAEKYNTEIYNMGMDLRELSEFSFNVNLKHHTISPCLN